MAKQTKQKDKRKYIHDSLWCPFRYNDNLSKFRAIIFLFAVVAEFAAISSIMLAQFIAGFDLLKQYWIGALLSLEICFVLFNIFYKKKPTLVNVLAYKSLSLVWGFAFYNLILAIGFNYHRLNDIFMQVISFIVNAIKSICITVGILAIVWFYIKINQFIAKKIEEK
jgi:hypothetical protein